MGQYGTEARPLPDVCFSDVFDFTFVTKALSEAPARLVGVNLGGCAGCLAHGLGQEPGRFKDSVKQYLTDV